MISNKRPNILVIMADQLRKDALDHDWMKIPNIRRIMDNGITFDKAYAPTPVCLPCRASFITGQYPSTHGNTHNETSLSQENIISLPDQFNQLGYYTHIIGKSHLNSVHQTYSPESPPHTMNHQFYRDWKGPWYGFTHADITTGHTTEHIACGGHYGAWLVDHGVDTSKYFGNTSYIAYGEWNIPEEYHYNSWIAEKTKEAIDNSTQKEDPFFLWVNFPDPHNPCVVPEPYAKMYDPDSIPKHGFKEGEPECFKDKPPFYQEMIDKKGSYAWRSNDNDLPSSTNACSLKFDEKQTQENAAVYYGMVSFMDKYIGKILDSLEEKGVLDNTIIVFTSDHGDMLGDHGMWWKSLVCYDEHMKVPMIISYPPLIPKGKRSDALHSTIDLSKTLLELAGCTSPETFEGINQEESWKDPEIKVRSHVIVEERPFDTPFELRVLISDTYKLCFYKDRGYGELYNTETDPNHITNLWNNPKYAQIKAIMLQKLLSMEMKKSKQNLSANKLVESQYPKELKEFPDFLETIGTLFIEENPETKKSQLMINATMSGMIMSSLEIPLCEMLEDLAGETLNLKIDDIRYKGTLSIEEEEHLYFKEKDQDSIIPLTDLLKDKKNKEIYIITLLNTKEKNVRYDVIFKDLFSNNKLY